MYIVRSKRNNIIGFPDMSPLNPLVRNPELILTYIIGHSLSMVPRSLTISAFCVAVTVNLSVLFPYNWHNKIIYVNVCLTSARWPLPLL